MGKIFRAKKAVAFARKGGGTQVIPADKVLREDDPIFAGRKDLLNDASLFEPLDDYLDRTVEQATAEPGDKRTVSRARKPRAAKPDKPAPDAPGVSTTKGAPGADGKQEGAK